MKLEELDKLEKDFLANIERQRERLHDLLTSLDKEEAQGRQAFRFLRSKASSNGAETILKAMQTSFEAGSLMDEMQQIIPTLKGTFDINTIREVIEGRNPTIRLNPTSVSNNLRKLHERGLIDRVSEGQGNKPAKYAIAQKWLDKLEEDAIEALPVPELFE